MKTKWVVLFLMITLSLFQLGMGHREGQYDEEAREEERQEKLAKKAEKAAGEERHPVKNFAGGVKQATLDSTAGLLEETSQGAAEAPVTGTLEGVRQGSEKVLDNTVKGAVKVATLGYGHVDHYEVEEPKKNSEEPTKIKLKF